MSVVLLVAVFRLRREEGGGARPNVRGGSRTENLRTTSASLLPLVTGRLSNIMHSHHSIVAFSVRKEQVGVDHHMLVS